MGYRLALSFLFLFVFASPSVTNAHETFLSPHIHSHHSHDHSEHGSGEESDAAKGIVEHAHADEFRLHITTGGRYTQYNLEDGDAHLFETGLGIAYDITHWLQITAEGRYGWFDSNSDRSDGWLPPRVGLEYHIPVVDGWEVAVGLKTQFPGVDPLGAEEWEVTPEFEVRYDRGTWYAGFIGEIAWVLNGDSHDGHTHTHGSDVHAGEEEEHEAEEHHEDHGAEDHDEGHAEHGSANDDSDIHRIIDPHAETEFGWEAVLGVRVLDQRLTLEGRVSGHHVIQGDSDGRHFLRAGARAIYNVTDRVAVLLNGSAPIGGPERNEWQTDLAVRVSF